MKLNSWEWDHSYNTRDVTVDGKYLEEVDTFDIDGIQGRHIAVYSKQSQPNAGILPNYFLWVGVQGHHYGMISWIFGELEKVNARWFFQFQRV